MKKIILLLLSLVAICYCGICFASDGNDLNKQQKTCERFIDAIDIAPAPEYSVIKPLLNEKLVETFTEKAYSNWQKGVKDQYGILKEAKFVAFERLGNVSRVTYLGTFEKKEKLVIIFVFDQKNALHTLAFKEILNPSEKQPAENQAK